VKRRRARPVLEGAVDGLGRPHRERRVLRLDAQSIPLEKARDSLALLAREAGGPLAEPLVQGWLIGRLARGELVHEVVLDHVDGPRIAD
jgi:hypothetical protein